MSNFKRACSVAGVTSSAKASLEECIDGLKQLIRTDDDEDALEVNIALFVVITCGIKIGILNASSCILAIYIESIIF